MLRNTDCTASTPSSAWITSNPSRVSTEETIRRRVGLSSAMTTVGIWLSLLSGLRRGLLTPDEAADRLDELVLVELSLQQIGAGASIQPGTLIFLAAPRGHDDDRHLLPATRTPNGAGQGVAVHSRHLDIGHDEISGVALQPRGAVEAVDGGDDVVAGAFEDHALKLADADGVLDDEHARLSRHRRRPLHRTSGCRDDRTRQRRLCRELAQVDEADHAAVTVDRRAGHQRQPAEERTKVLDHQLQLALDLVARPRNLPVGMAHDDGDTGFAIARDIEGSAEVEQRQRHAMAYDDRLAGEGVDVGVFQRQRLDDTGNGDR